MPVMFDLPLPELERYRPEVAEPPDFLEFWRTQLTDARSHPLQATFVPVDTRLRHADVLDVTFAGHGGNPIRAWLFVPQRLAPSPVMVVEYIGYGGGRGLPVEWLSYSCAGHPHLVMDTRGQGHTWRGGDTPDAGEDGAPGGGGFLTRGVLDPRRQYYTRLFVDAARAVEAARAHPAADGLPMVTTGGSQGGGLALAATHLSSLADNAVEAPDTVAATMPDVPFLANFERALRITASSPYDEIITFCKVYPQHTAQVFASLSYLDVVNHARRTTCPALFSVGLVDDITPASTVYAAYNHYAGSKQIRSYPFNGHEGGGQRHFEVKLEFLEEVAGVSGARVPVRPPARRRSRAAVGGR
jgi:cephalosporin-C deacetylase